MKYASLDLETTAMDPEQGAILQIGAVVEDTDIRLPMDKLPFANYLVVPRNGIVVGQVASLAFNSDLLEAVAEALPAVRLLKANETTDVKVRGRAAKAGDLLSCLNDMVAFLQNELGDMPWVMAGKNIGNFDMPWLPKAIRAAFDHRLIDAGAVALGQQPDLWHEKRPPGLRTLIDADDVEHDAVSDAMDVIEANRKTYPPMRELPKPPPKKRKSRKPKKAPARKRK